MIESRVLAQRVGKILEEFVGDNDVWRPTPAAEGKSILWRSGPPEDEITRTSEPGVGLGLHLELFLRAPDAEPCSEHAVAGVGLR